MSKKSSKCLFHPFLSNMKLLAGVSVIVLIIYTILFFSFDENELFYSQLSEIALNSLLHWGDTCGCCSTNINLTWCSPVVLKSIKDPTNKSFTTITKPLYCTTYFLVKSAIDYRVHTAAYRHQINCVIMYKINVFVVDFSKEDFLF